MAPDTERMMEAWRRTSKSALTPKHPFKLHQQLFSEAYQHWPHDSHGPPPVWVPSLEEVAQTNLAKFMATFDADLAWLHQRTGDPQKDLALLHAVSCSNPEAYWGAVLRHARLNFIKPPSRILQEHPNPDHCKWLPGARLNIAACAVTSSLAPAPNAPAIVCASEDRPTSLHTVTWEQLKHQAYHRAACILACFEPGDAIAICMPMGVDAVLWYLAIVLAGCAVVSIADSFAPDEIAMRLRIARAKAVVTQDVIHRGGKAHPLYSKMVDAGAPIAIVLSADKAQHSSLRLRACDLYEHQMLGKAAVQAVQAVHAVQGDAVPHVCNADDVTNILFSSGTTGEPKAITWTHVTPLKCMADAWANQDVKPGEVVCWPTNMGWMMGPWLVYAALLNGATIAIYEGSPLGAEFGVFVEAAGVNMLGLVPSLVKTWRQNECMKDVDWSCVRCFSSTGEASSPEDYHWLSALGGYKPVIEYCGGTELGGAYLTGSLLQPQAASTFSTPTMGTSLTLLCPDGAQSPHDSHLPATGEVALVPPLLGSSQALLNRDHYKTYYEGMPQHEATGRILRRHGDELQRLPGGRYTALGRCDDTMNLGGIKVASVELERVVTTEVPEVLEAAAVGVPSPGGGPELLFLFVVVSTQSDTTHTTQLKQRCQAAIREHLNPLFKVGAVEVRESLPRNTSGKIMRRVLRDDVMARAKPRSRL